MVVDIFKRNELYELEEKVKTLVLDTHVPIAMRFIYSCGKIEKALQEILDAQVLNIVDDVSLEKPYNDLLMYSLICLDNEKIPLVNLFTQQVTEVDGTEVYSLMEYAIKRYDAPLSKVYDRNFKDVLRTILMEVVESKHFEKIKQKAPWS